MNNEHLQLVKLLALLQNENVSIGDVYIFLKENIHVFTNTDFLKIILKESFMLLTILDESDEDIDLIFDVIILLTCVS
jgi:hypothetical protein